MKLSAIWKFSSRSSSNYFSIIYIKNIGPIFQDGWDLSKSHLPSKFWKYPQLQIDFRKINASTLIKGAIILISFLPAMASSGMINLGLLSTFQREIRDQIWDAVAFSPKEIAILRTCKQIYTEVTSRIYDYEVLAITIIPDQSPKKVLKASISSGTT